MRAAIHRIATTAIAIMIVLALTAPSASALEIKRMQLSNGAVLLVSEQHQLRLGYGAASEGFAVDPDGPLRVEGHESGAFFRLDIDSERSAPEDSVPPLVVSDVLSIADTLHDAIRDAFESAITPTLREHFRGTDGDG